MKKIPTRTEILESLCMYDPRNPLHFAFVDEAKQRHCKCDNCFHGLTPLAELLIDFINKSQVLVSA